MARPAGPHPLAPSPDSGRGGNADNPLPEFALIRRFLAGASDPERGDVQVGPGDDCAVVGEGIVLSTDLSVEGIHFRRDWLSPREIGYRAACAALSDLAAMAARPIGVLASLAVGEGDAGDYAVRVMDGVREAAERVGGVVLGGDLTRSPGPLVLDVAVVGEARAPVLRSGARPGDEVWVTGELGAAAVAVAHLLRGEAPPPGAAERFARPVPRVREARWLRERAPLTALIDLSDGLAGDAAHVASASGVTILLGRASIPIHPAVATAAASRDEALAHAVSGGEDYELCFTAAKGGTAPLAGAFEEEFGVRLTRVGRVEEGDGVFWEEADGSRVAIGAGGFQHFGGGA